MPGVYLQQRYFPIKPRKLYSIQEQPPAEGLVLDSLRLYFDMGNPNSYPGSGTTWNDIADVIPDATAQVIQSTSEISYDSANGGSWAFNPTSDTGQVSNIGFVIGQPYTVSDPTITFSFWVKVGTALTTGATLIGYSVNETPAVAGRLQIKINTNYSIEVVKAAIASSGVFPGSQSKLTPGVITNIVVTKAGTLYKLYINGEYVSEFTSSNTYNVGSSCLGQSYNPGAPFSFRAIEKFKGNMYVFMVYDAALTAAQVLQNYNVQKGRYGL